MDAIIPVPEFFEHVTFSVLLSPLDLHTLGTS